MTLQLLSLEAEKGCGIFSFTALMKAVAETTLTRKHTLKTQARVDSV